MNIKQAELLSGVSKDMIRYYEKKGLIKPKRNQENKYRNYEMRDIYCLVSIKKYSTMGIPLKKIKELFTYEHANEAADCLEEVRKELEQELKRIHDRIEYAKYNEELLRQVGAHVEGEYVLRYPFFFYKNDENINRTATYVKGGVFHPVFRIREMEDGREITSGMTFVEQILEEIKCEKYEKTLIYRVIVLFQNAHDLENLNINGIKEKLLDDGYILNGDIFGYRVMDKVDEDPKEVVVLEYPVTKK